MRSLNIFLLMLMTVIFYSCKNKHENHDYKIIYADLKNKELKISSFVENLQIIPLETKKESLLGNVSKILSAKEKLFFLSNHSIFIFDRKGNFINKIDNIGQGPNEYIDCSDFYIEKSAQEIWILDRTNKKLISYDYKGNYKNSIKLPFYAWQISCIKNGNISVYLGNDNSGGDFKFINLDERSVVKESFHPINKNMAGVLTLCKDYFYNSEKYSLFYEPYNDTIYTMEAKNIKPKYVIDYNGYNIPRSFFEKKYKDAMIFSQEYKRTDYVNSTYNVVETDNLVLFTSYKKRKKYLTLYDKKKEKSQSYDSIIDDFYLKEVSLDFQDYYFHFWPIDKNTILLLVPSSFLSNHRKNIQENVLNEILNVQEEDNPVCYLFKIR